MSQYPRSQNRDLHPTDQSLSVGPGRGHPAGEDSSLVSRKFAEEQPQILRLRLPKKSGANFAQDDNRNSYGEAQRVTAGDLPDIDAVGTELN